MHVRDVELAAINCVRRTHGGGRGERNARARPLDIGQQEVLDTRPRCSEGEGPVRAQFTGELFDCRGVVRE